MDSAKKIIKDSVGNFREATVEEEAFSQEVIADISEHDYLQKYAIKLIFCDKPKKKKGRKVLGTAKVFSDQDRLLHGLDALIVLDLDFWVAHPSKRRALIDHELCHLGEKEDGGLETLPHDLEEFYNVIKRHGDWLGDVQPINAAQLSFEYAKGND